MYVCMHMCIYVCMDVCVCIYGCMCMYVSMYVLGRQIQGQNLFMNPARWPNHIKVRSTWDEFLSSDNLVAEVICSQKKLRYWKEN